MTHSSALSIINDNTVEAKDIVIEQIHKAKRLVTEGRYLIVVFEAPSDWGTHLPIEALVISETLQGIHDRTSEWEFFGNGVIRLYSSKTLRYSKAFQWTVVRRAGEKPYSRKGEFNATQLKVNQVPVSDKVFTRDVANNVWHLKSDTFRERLIARFKNLLTWQDEDFIVLDGGRKVSYDLGGPLSLREDLVGVPQKIEYYWDSGDVLF
jgi:hypothetical protein